MVRQHFRQVFQRQRRQGRIERRLLTRANLQFGAYLPGDAQSKIRRSSIVHRDDHSTAQHAPEERCDPFSGVLAPEEHVVAHINSPRLKLRGKLRGGFADLPVGPPCYAVATRVDVRDISTVARKLFQVFQE